MLPELNHPKELSAAIKKARTDRKLTRDELASKVGVSPRMIEAYESFGKANYTAPRPAIREQLNKIFYPGVGSRDVGNRKPQVLAIRDATDDELIKELKARGVSWYKYARA